MSEAPNIKAGRNLPAAIASGVVLVVLVVCVCFCFCFVGRYVCCCIVRTRERLGVFVVW